MAGSQTRKKRDMKDVGKEPGPLNSLVTLTGEGWACDSGGGEVQLWLPVS